MTIAELLKLPAANARLSYGDVWLYWDESIEQWVVLQHLSRKRSPKTIVETENESEAAAAFCKAAGIEMEVNS